MARPNEGKTAARRGKGKKLTSVYPTEKAARVLGEGSAAMTRAIECWAALIGPATHDNAVAIKPAEWAFLAAAVRGRRFDPLAATPGPALAAAVREARDIFGQVEPLKGAPAVDALAEKVQDMDYLHAWAVLWSVMWFLESGGDVSDQEEWWTVARRARR